LRDIGVQVDFDLIDEIENEDETAQDSGVYETISEETEDETNGVVNGGQVQSIKKLLTKNTKRTSLFNRHNTKFDDSNISGRRDSYYRRQSYLTTSEYISAPYYQYQTRHPNRVDKGCSTNDHANEINSAHESDATLNTDDYKANMLKLAKLPFFKSHSQATSQPSATSSSSPVNAEIKIKTPNDQTDEKDNLKRHGLYNLGSNENRKSIFEEIYNRFEAEVKVNPKQSNNQTVKIDNTDKASIRNGDATDQLPRITQNIILNNGNHIISNDNITTIKIFNPRSVMHIYFVRIDENGVEAEQQ
jgi:hypothetical protein